MTTKQKALKGLLILAVVLGVSMFFARTVQTITTPKVQKIKAARGKLEDKISLSGEVFFPEGESIVLPEAAGLGVSVSKVLAKEGYLVKEGDLLLETTAGEYDKQIETLMAEYKKAARALVDERAKTIRLDASTPHNDIYNAMVQASDAFYMQKYETTALAAKLGYDLDPDITRWGTLPEELVVKPKGKKAENIPEPLPPIQADKEKYPGMQEAIDKAYAAYLESLRASNRLLDVYAGVGGLRRAANNTFDSIKKQDEAREQMAEAQRKMLELEGKLLKVQQVHAPHAGYLTKFALKVGDSYDGVKPLYTISKEGDAPSLRCDITDVKKTLKKGMKVTVEGIKGELKIDDIVLSGDRKYAQIPLTSKQISEIGGLSALIGKQVPVTITYRADKTTTLIPASALRTDTDGSAFVFTVQEQYGGMLSNSGFTVKKTPVTVVEKSDKMVSLQDDLSFYDVADNEDRTISDGQQVMEYVD